MILLLGANGYVGQAFANALRRRKCCFVPLARNALDYTRFEFLFDYVRHLKPEFVINASEYLDLVNGAASDPSRMELLRSNTLLPQTVARVCGMTRIPWGNVVSGSIYRGAKILDDTGMRIESDLGRPGMRKLFESHPDRFIGFSEHDLPNRSFPSAACSFDYGTKALAEETTVAQGQHYTWRLRLPFNEEDDQFNFLSHLIKNPSVRDGLNSLSHLDDSVRACLDLWNQRARFGTYNIVNPGAVRTREIIGMIQRILKPHQRFEGVVGKQGHLAHEPEEGPHDCILDGSKLAGTGIHMRPVRQALEHSLRRWQPRLVECP